MVIRVVPGGGENTLAFLGYDAPHSVPRASALDRARSRVGVLLAVENTGVRRGAEYYGPLSL